MVGRIFHLNNSERVWMMCHTQESFMRVVSTLSAQFWGFTGHVIVWVVVPQQPLTQNSEIERERNNFLFRHETWIWNHQRTIEVNRTFYSRRTVKWKWNVYQMEVKCEKFSQIDLSSFRCKFQSAEKKIAFCRYVGDQQRYHNHTIATLWKLELDLPRRQWEKLSEISFFFQCSRPVAISTSSQGCNFVFSSLSSLCSRLAPFTRSKIRKKYPDNNAIIAHQHSAPLRFQHRSEPFRSCRWFYWYFSAIFPPTSSYPVRDRVK